MGISTLIKEVEKFQKETDSNRYEIFFRGQKCSDKLVTKLLRPSLDECEVKEYKENHLYCDSWVMGNNEFINCRNSWEILAKMQHYGIPTRFLDWTGSLLSGIYFAISECIDCKYMCEEKTNKRDGCRGNPCLWVLNSWRMHQELYPNLELDKISFTIGIDEIVDYADIFVKQDQSKSWVYNNGPIFMEIPWSNSRITSQKGYFTFHSDKAGESPKPLEELLKTSIFKYEIDPKLKNQLVEEFRIMGVSEFDIYPDLSSIGRHTIRNLKG